MAAELLAPTDDTADLKAPNILSGKNRLKVDPSLVNNSPASQRKPVTHSGNQGAMAYGSAANAAEPAVAGSATGSSRLHLSPAASRLMASANSGNDIDEAKVAAIRAAIADGSYRVDSSNIANGMLQDSREQLRRQG